MLPKQDLLALCGIVERYDALDMTQLRDNSPTEIILHSTWRHPSFESVLSRHRGRGWAGVGYHVFIDKGALVHLARPFDKEGAHALGFNLSSIGVCAYAPDGVPSRDVLRAARDVVGTLQEQLDLPVISHTRAQLRYFNAIFEKRGVPVRLPDEDAVLPAQFESQKRTVNATMARYGIHDGVAGTVLKRFKNCPGPLFYEVVR